MEEAERRYSDEEVRRILEEASRAEDVLGSSPEVLAPTSFSDGLTLSEIQQIAGEALIDPAAVERAARNLRDPQLIRVPLDPTGPFTRIIRGELMIRRRLSDAEMRVVALEVERSLARRGHILRSADTAEWRDEEKRFSVRFLRGKTATRVSVTYDQSSELLGGSTVLAGIGTGAAVALTTVATPALFAVLPLVIAGTIGLVWLNAIGRSATTRERLRELLEQVDAAVLSE